MYFAFLQSRMHLRDLALTVSVDKTSAVPQTSNRKIRGSIQDPSKRPLGHVPPLEIVDFGNPLLPYLLQRVAAVGELAKRQIPQGPKVIREKIRTRNRLFVDADAGSRSAG